MTMCREAAKVKFHPRRIQQSMKRLILFLAATAVLASCGQITMPDPTGPEKVGTTVLEVRDNSRTDPRFGAPDSKRRILMRAWYPASDTANARAVPSVTPRQAGALVKYMGMPAMMFEEQTPTASFADAPVKEGSRWPVLIFEHGMYSYETQSFYLLQDLASHGYVVITVR
jgi:hypothetical protein